MAARFLPFPPISRIGVSRQRYLAPSLSRVYPHCVRNNTRHTTEREHAMRGSARKRKAGWHDRFPALSEKQVENSGNSVGRFYSQSIVLGYLSRVLTRPGARESSDEFFSVRGNPQIDVRLVTGISIPIHFITRSDVLRSEK